jgi:sugar/nucleoside kinase (ribokinase family)
VAGVADSSIGLVGSLTVDRVDGGPPRIGGAVFYAARAAARLGADATVATRCAAVDRDSLVSQLESFGLPVTWAPGASTCAFSFDYDGDHRAMTVDVVGDPWSPADVAGWASTALRTEWVHVGALLRSDFPTETIAALATEGRRLLVDAQGLVRIGAVGSLHRDGDVDRDLLRHLAVLKLNEDEAAILAGGDDPDALRALGVPEVVLTLGASGSLVVTPESVSRVEITPLSTADPTGAGDTYSFAYLHARARGQEPADAARSASAVVSAILAGL